MNVQAVGLGGVLAIVVLVLDVVLWFLGKPPGGPEAAALIGLLAVARLT